MGFLECIMQGAICIDLKKKIKKYKCYSTFTVIICAVYDAKKSELLPY